MLHFVLGVAGSGKSLYAEQLIATYQSPTVYCGTLPLIAYYSESIRHHRERRPADWGLIELIGDPMTDLKLLETALQAYRNLLLDGLSFYLLQLATGFHLDMAEARLQAISIIEYAARCSGQVLIVDAPVQCQEEPYEEQMFRNVHELLAVKAQRITLFDEGSVKSLNVDDVFHSNWPRHRNNSDPRLNHMLHCVSRGNRNA
ncbi:MAG TPA: bifunctional adenosylcobinamide kinase/adenosylcobinamide-phosphate guanylyltransferase [Pyrinomonadaceae bacterium]|nr:bifunctional adenosylcobinamide kinase/adenosylcobinamide-phosphate guanylyltransferase [Pyrinomonadaceae bacterium]